MSPVARKRVGSQAERLSLALRTTGVSRRQLAIALLDGDASKQRIESKKSQITRWLGGKHGISENNARALAAAFRKLGHGYTDEAFARSPGAPRSWHEEMASIWEAQQEILEELKKLREASQAHG